MRSSCSAISSRSGRSTCSGACRRSAADAMPASSSATRHGATAVRPLQPGWRSPRRRHAFARHRPHPARRRRGHPAARPRIRSADRRRRPGGDAALLRPPADADAPGLPGRAPPARMGAARVRAPHGPLQRHAGRRGAGLPGVVPARRRPARCDGARAAHAGLPGVLPAPARARRHGHRLAGARRSTHAGVAPSCSPRPPPSRIVTVMKVVLYLRIEEIRWTISNDDLRRPRGALSGRAVRARHRRRRAARRPRPTPTSSSASTSRPSCSPSAAACAGCTPWRPASRRTCSRRWWRATSSSPTPPACTRSTSPSTPSAWCARSRATCTSRCACRRSDAGIATPTIAGGRRLRAARGQPPGGARRRRHRPGRRPPGARTRHARARDAPAARRCPSRAPTRWWAPTRCTRCSAGPTSS